MDIANQYPVHVIRRESAGWTIALGVLLIILGLFALVAPLIAGVAVTVLLGWLLIFGGIAHLVVSWHLRQSGGLIWELLIGLAYIVDGHIPARPSVGRSRRTHSLPRCLSAHQRNLRTDHVVPVATHSRRRMGPVRLPSSRCCFPR